MIELKFNIIAFKTILLVFVVYVHGIVIRAYARRDA